MKSGPMVTYLKNFEGSPLCCKMAPTGPIMTSQENVKNFLLPDTSSQNLTWAKFEEIAPNPSERGTFPHDLSLLF